MSASYILYVVNVSVCLLEYCVVMSYVWCVCTHVNLCMYHTANVCVNLGAYLYVYVPLFTVSCLLLLLCVQSHVRMCAVIMMFCQIKVIIDMIHS